jgi:hypothetical protein
MNVDQYKVVLYHIINILSFCEAKSERKIIAPYFEYDVPWHNVGSINGTTLFFVLMSQKSVGDLVQAVAQSYGRERDGRE